MTSPRGQPERTVCAICLADLNATGDLFETRGLQCGHNFHETCLDQWLGVNSSCPYCRDLVPHTTRLIYVIFRNSWLSFNDYVIGLEDRPLWFWKGKWMIQLTTKKLRRCLKEGLFLYGVSVLIRRRLYERSDSTRQTSQGRSGEAELFDDLNPITGVLKAFISFDRKTPPRKDDDHDSPDMDLRIERHKVDEHKARRNRSTGGRATPTQGASQPQEDGTSPQPSTASPDSQCETRPLVQLLWIYRKTEERPAGNDSCTSILDRGLKMLCSRMPVRTSLHPLIRDAAVKLGARPKVPSSPCPPGEGRQASDAGQDSGEGLPLGDRPSRHHSHHASPPAQRSRLPPGQRSEPTTERGTPRSGTPNSGRSRIPVPTSRQRPVVRTMPRSASQPSRRPAVPRRWRPLFLQPRWRY